MRYLSVCSGVEAASVAWHDLGWTPVGFSEIEPFPSAVLAHRFPHVKNYGDMTKYKEWDLEPGTIDVLVGGTPCQSFSVAGLRKGLDDPRGNLMLVYLGLAEHLRVPWLVWENVPGVLSSNGGRDFGTFLGALGELNYQFAARVLDAQHFGVPQRRRRVFVVAHRGAEARPEEVLFEREGVRRDSSTPQQEGEVTWWDGKATSQTLDAVLYKGQMLPEKNRFPVIAIGERSSLPPTATKTEIALLASWITPSASVLDRLRTTCMSTAKTETESSGRVYLRRVTPIEAERLMGFPDDHTNIPWRGKPAPDGPRYKAMGNSMAVPVMRWIGERLDRVAKGES
jgi:DNA (cytosine-5)-methyltransferase 1